jgi:hypothetical protein
VQTDKQSILRDKNSTMHSHSSHVHPISDSDCLHSSVESAVGTLVDHVCACDCVVDHDTVKERNVH